MKNLIEKILEERTNDASVKNDYAAFIAAITATKSDESLNDNKDIAKAAAKAISTLDEFPRFCLEERFLRGKTLDEVADEVRRAFEAGEFTDEFINETITMLHRIFMASVDEILYDMQYDSFRELRELHNRKKAEKCGSADSPEQSGANSRIIDIIYDSIETLDDAGYCCADIFKGYFLEGESKTALTMLLSDNPTGSVEVTEEHISNASYALLDAVSDKVEDMFYDMKNNGFLELKAQDPDGSHKRGTTIGLDGSRRVIDVMKDAVSYLLEHGTLYRDVFEKHFMQGLAKERLAKFISENMKVYVDETISSALRSMRAQSKSKKLIRTAKRLNQPNSDTA